MPRYLRRALVTSAPGMSRMPARVARTCTRLCRWTNQFEVDDCAGKPAVGFQRKVGDDSHAVIVETLVESRRPAVGSGVEDEQRAAPFDGDALRFQHQTTRDAAAAVAQTGHQL